MVHGPKDVLVKCAMGTYVSVKSKDVLVKCAMGTYVSVAWATGTGMYNS